MDGGEDHVSALKGCTIVVVGEAEALRPSVLNCGIWTTAVRKCVCVARLNMASGALFRPIKSDSRNGAQEFAFLYMGSGTNPRK